MKTKRWTQIGIVLGMSAGSIYVLWRRSQHRVEELPDIPAEQAHHILARAAPLLCLPTSPDRQPEVLPDGSGLRCPATGRIYPYRKGVLDLLESQLTLTLTQHSLNTPFTAWAYDRFRETITRSQNAPDFPTEVAMLQESL